MVYSQMTVIVGAGSGQNQEPGIPSTSATWMAGVQIHVPCAIAFPSTLAGSLNGPSDGMLMPWFNQLHHSTASTLHVFM